VIRGRRATKALRKERARKTASCDRPGEDTWLGENIPHLVEGRVIDLRGARKVKSGGETKTVKRKEGKLTRISLWTKEAQGDRTEKGGSRVSWGKDSTGPQTKRGEEREEVRKIDRKPSKRSAGVVGMKSDLAYKGWEN